jgi:hypothetical protein
MEITKGRERSTITNRGLKLALGIVACMGAAAGHYSGDIFKAAADFVNNGSAPSQEQLAKYPEEAVFVNPYETAGEAILKVDPRANEETMSALEQFVDKEDGGMLQANTSIGIPEVPGATLKHSEHNSSRTIANN